MELVYIIELIINSLLILLYHTHMFQLNSYFLKKNIRWIRRKKWKIIMQLLFVITSALCYGSGYVWSKAIALTLMLISCIYNCPKRKSKISLKYTGRAIRLIITGLIFEIIICGIGGFQSNIPYKLESVNVLSVFIIMIANVINYPVEKIARTWYINDAKRILSDCTNLIVIGVTGSYGKTSVKNYLAKTLSPKYEVLVTPQNYNTTMGVVKTIRENLKATHQIFVCEMGATKPNDIKEICDIVKPKYGIITSIGPQHIESFRSIDNVIRTKFELADSVKLQGGTIFLNCDNEYIRQRNIDMNVVKYGVENNGLDFEAYDMHSSEQGVSFYVRDKNNKCYSFATKVIGRHNIVNITGAIAVASELGVSMESIIPRVRELKNVEHRLQLICNDRINIIDDAYNSNPVSCKMAIDTLNEFDGIKIIVTPGLIELGADEPKYNFEFGEYITKVCDYVFLVGEHSKMVYDGIKAKRFDNKKVFFIERPQDAIHKITGWNLKNKVTVLLENDLPDNY